MIIRTEARSAGAPHVAASRQFREISQRGSAPLVAVADRGPCAARRAHFLFMVGACSTPNPLRPTSDELPACRGSSAFGVGSRDVCSCWPTAGKGPSRGTPFCAVPVPFC
jgi:hypothetical protein